MWNGSVALTCLLVLAGFGGHASAARTKQQRREQRNPYMILPPGLPTEAQDRHVPKALGEKKFTLRHIYHHGTHDYPELHRYMDVPPGAELRVLGDDGITYVSAPKELRVKVSSTEVQRLVHRKPSDIDSLLHHARIHGEPAKIPSSAWTIEEIPGPNISDHATVVAFAKMAEDAYAEVPGEGDWMDVGQGWNVTDHFGWESDGLRGHIFMDDANTTVVVALKGTTVAVFDGVGTTTKDKVNDNLFGSCCCAQGGQLLWHQVCDCMSSAYTCNSTCLVKTLHEKDKYYYASKELYGNVSERYPGKEVWLTGHSLGGVVSSLLGLSFTTVAVTFEAFPDALAASRLGLPVPPGYRVGAHHSREHMAIYHIGHTADPIYMGSCNAASSWCTIGGYAFEGLCHTGQTCIYDTVNEHNWGSSAMSHKIKNVINNVLPLYEEGPKCDVDPECGDCPLWKYYESNGTETTTTSRSMTSTSTRTRTRTETCKTPGWWGCLDESTTTTGSNTVTSTSSTSSKTTSTCKTPGWFGCKDPVTTTTSVKATITTPRSAPAPTTTSASEPSTSCKTPGWLGCKDSVTTTTTVVLRPSATTTIPAPTKTVKPSTSTVVPTASETTSTACTSKEWFGLICVDPSPTDASFTSLVPTDRPVEWRRTCIARNWYGTCKSWEAVPVHAKVDL